MKTFEMQKLKLRKNEMPKRWNVKKLNAKKWYDKKMLKLKKGGHWNKKKSLHWNVKKIGYGEAHLNPDVRFFL